MDLTVVLKYVAKYHRIDARCDAAQASGERGGLFAREDAQMRPPGSHSRRTPPMQQDLNQIVLGANDTARRCISSMYQLLLVGCHT